MSPCGSKGPFHVTINLNSCLGRLAPIPHDMDRSLNHATDRHRLRAHARRRRGPKTILIAAGRQLLVILNAMIRSQQPLRL